MSPLAKVTIENLAGGAALEQVNHVLGKAWENVFDPNTDPEAKRKVVLEVEIEPTENRDSAAITFKVKANLPGPVGVTSLVFMAEDTEGKPVALTRDIRQMEAFPEDQPPDGVRPINSNPNKVQAGGRS